MQEGQTQGRVGHDRISEASPWKRSSSPRHRLNEHAAVTRRDALQGARAPLPPSSGRAGATFESVPRNRVCTICGPGTLSQYRLGGARRLRCLTPRPRGMLHLPWRPRRVCRRFQPRGGHGHRDRRALLRPTCVDLVRAAQEHVQLGGQSWVKRFDFSRFHESLPLPKSPISAVRPVTGSPFCDRFSTRC